MPSFFDANAQSTRRNRGGSGTKFLAAVSSLLTMAMFFTSVPADAADGAVSAGERSAAERELVRRRAYQLRGEQMLEKGVRALKIRDYERASACFKFACDFIPNGGQSQKTYLRALRNYCDASCRLAEQRIMEGRYAEADNRLRVVLDERYDPTCKEAIRILARLELVAWREKVKHLFIEAQGFYETDRYALAVKRCEQIEVIDPSNAAASNMLESIERVEAKLRVMNVADMRLSEKLIKKLRLTVIPSVEFKGATIREAVEYLKAKSVELDPVDDPKTGVNIVLKLDPAPLDAPQSSVGSAADTRITLTLSNVPLVEALRFVTGRANLKLKVEPNAVTLVPLSVPADVTNSIDRRDRASKRW
jgi:general secretion pathway protein D